ncbi:hypothetical protein [Phaeobacter sp. JH209A]|uniref:hypothetical protein n=1 Tax=Phaeobacter sp. JH209A TaxID=3112505 RepID=UPI003A86F278
MSAIEIGSVRASASFDAAAFVTGANKTRSQLRALGGTFEATSRDALRSMEAIERGWDAGVSKAKSSAKDHTLAVLGLVQANSRGSASAREWAAELNRNAQSFDNLRASLDPVFAASKRYEAVVEQVENAVQSGVTSQSTANRVLDQAAQKYLGLGSVAEQAAAAQKKIAAETAAAAGSYRQLRASVDPAFAAAERYKAAIETLSAAQRAGVISDKERAATLQMLKDQMQGVGGGAIQAGKGMSKFGLVANQVGYQIQDVFVSGPMIGWLRAVSQQAPQAAGAFAMLGGSIGTILPWMGTAVAVGAALIPVLSGMGGEASKLEDTLKRLEASVSDYRSAADLAAKTSVELSEQYGAAADRAMELFEINRELARLDALSEIRKATSLLAEQFGNLGGISRDSFLSLGETMDNTRETIETLSAGVADLGTDQLLRVNNQILALNEGLNGLGPGVLVIDRIAETLGVGARDAGMFAAALVDLNDAASLEEHASAMQEVLRLFREATGATGQLNEEQQSVLRSLLQASMLALDTEKAIGQGANEASRLAAEARGAADALLATYQNALGLQQAMASLAVPFADAMADLDFEISTAGMNAADKLVATRVRRLEETMRAASENAFGFDYGLTTEQQQQLEEYESALRKSAGALTATSKAKGKAAKASAKAAAQLKKEAAAVRAGLSPVTRYNQELAELVKLKGLLSEDEMAQAIRNLNVELADSLPLVGDLADSFTDGLFNGFKGTLDDMGDMFKRWLKEMIATGLRNQIVLGLGLGGGGGVGGAAQVAAGAAGGGGGLLNLLGGGANLLTGGGLVAGIAGGAGAALGIGGYASAGLFNIGANAAVASAATGAGAFVSTIGAALPALGIIAGGIAILAKGLSREHHGRAVRGTLGPDGFDGFEFDFYQGGFLRGDKSVRHDTRDEIQTMLDSATTGIVNNIETMAGALNLGAEAIKDFEWEGEQFTVWLTGRNAGDQEATAKEFEKHLNTLANGMTDLVLKTEEYTREGESSYETLTRLGGSLMAANDGFELLSQTLFEGSLEAANSASLLMDAFGGIEQFASGVGSFFELMFTDVEKQAKRQQYAQEALDAAAADLNLTLPTTHAEFRALIGGLDRTTEEGREAYVTLIGLADEFSVVHGTAQEAADALDGVAGALADAEAEARKLKEQDLRDAFAALNGAISAAVADLQGQLGIVEDRLRLRFKRLQVSVDAERQTISVAHEKLLDTLSGRLATLEEAAEASRALFETLEAASQDRRRVEREGAEWERRRALIYVQNGGSDPGKLSNALEVLGEDNSGQFSNYADYLTDYYRTSNIIAGRAGDAQLEMTADEAAVDALERQIELAERLHQEEMQRLDQIIEDGRKTLDMALGEYIAAINVENAVNQLNQTADRHAIVSERVETRLLELETIRSTMEQLVTETLGGNTTLVSINAGITGVAGAVQALGGSLSGLAAGIAANAAAQREANRIAQIKALERTQTINSQQPGRAAAGAQAVSKEDTTAREVREMRKELVGYLGPISKATGATDRSLKRVVRDGLTTKGAA